MTTQTQVYKLGPAWNPDKQKERAKLLGVTISDKDGFGGDTFTYGGDSGNPKRKYVITKILRSKGIYVLVLRDKEIFKGPELFAVKKRGRDGLEQFKGVRDPVTLAPIDEYETEKYSYQTQFYKD